MKPLLLLGASLFCFVDSWAQHCPFDGAHLVCIKVVNRQGKIPQQDSTVFWLQEVDNPDAENCTSAPGLVKKQFLSSAAFVADCNERYGRNGYDDELKERLFRAGVFTNAGFMINLNMAEHICTLIGKSETVYTNYIYRHRKFVIVYKAGDKLRSVPVPQHLIYHLCRSAVEIKKFKPVVIRM